MRDARHHDRHGRARDRRLELITGSKRRRTRSAREKAAIVAETFAPGANVPEIARRHGLNRGLLFSWRRQVRRARPGPVAEAASEEAQDPVFVPVEIGKRREGERICELRMAPVCRALSLEQARERRPARLSVQAALLELLAAARGTVLVAACTFE